MNIFFNEKFHDSAKPKPNPINEVKIAKIDINQTNIWKFGKDDTLASCLTNSPTSIFPATTCIKNSGLVLKMTHIEEHDHNMYNNVGIKLPKKTLRFSIKAFFPQ